MSPSKMAQKVKEVTEPHRKPMGKFAWLSGLLMFLLLLAIFNYREHNYARMDRRQAMKERNRVAVIEDRIRDALLGGKRPLVLMYIGEDGNNHLLNWPKSITALLGWTFDDIDQGGLELIIPDEIEIQHDTKMRAALEGPKSERRTVVLHRDATHKDGRLVPVRITVWVLGGGTRAVGAYIEAESMVLEVTR